jgi:hypothetical protein
MLACGEVMIKNSYRGIQESKKQDRAQFLEFLRTGPTWNEDDLQVIEKAQQELVTRRFR